MKAALLVFFTLMTCTFVQASINWSKLQSVLKRLPEQKVTGEQYEARLRSLKKWNESINSKIVGGSTAEVGQFPYQAAVTIDFVYFCGGTLISKYYVLTAAHCGVLGYSFTIYLGSINIRLSTEPTRQTIISQDVVVHENYNSTTTANDIAILKLPSSAEFNDYVAPINLPRYSQVNESFTGEEVIASGWGKTSDSAGGITSTLHYTPLKVIENSVCANYYGEIITISQICAIGSNKQSTCNGDSGGPLAINDGNNSLLVGVICFVSDEGCESGVPSGYTRVTTFLDWIQSHSDVIIEQ